MINFRVLPRAKKEVVQTARWYERRQAGLGDRFLDELDQVYALICRDPFAIPKYEFSPKRDPARRQKLKSFPVLVLFAVHDDEVVVIAVPHTSRKPNYWRRRKLH